MADWLRNTNCPNCGSRDNLAEYDDGSAWCWGCRYYRKAEGRSIQDIKNRLSCHAKGARSHDLELPGDVVPPNAYMGLKGLKWLKQYGLTNKEIADHGFVWSESEQQLIYPVPGTSGGLSFYSARNFADGRSKYTITGKKDVLQVNAEPFRERSICFVEDIVSGIRLARHTNVACLFGCSINLGVAAKFSKIFDKAIMWLDPDKTKESAKQANIIAPLFKQGALLVVSDKDPKELSDKEIKILLDKYL